MAIFGRAGNVGKSVSGLSKNIEIIGQKKLGKSLSSHWKKAVGWVVRMSHIGNDGRGIAKLLPPEEASNLTHSRISRRNFLYGR